MTLRAALAVTALVVVCGCGEEERSRMTVTCVVDFRPESPFGLKSTTLRKTKGGLTVTWRTNAPMPRSGSVLYYVFAYREDPYIGRRFGVEYRDGARSAYFANARPSFDFDATHATNVKGSVKVGRNFVRAVFPESKVEPFGEPSGDSFAWWSGIWSEAVHDSCPGPTHDPLDLRTLPFPG